MPTRRRFLGIAVPLVATGTGCLGGGNGSPSANTSDCNFGEPVAEPPVGERVTEYGVCAFVRDVRGGGLTGTPLEFGVETVDDTITEDGPAVLELSVTNSGVTPTELLTGAAPPFSTLRARAYDDEGTGGDRTGGFLLWSDSYEETRDISVRRGRLTRNDIGVNIKLLPGETQTQRYEIYMEVSGVSAGRYVIEDDFGETEFSFGLVLSPDSTEEVSVAPSADCTDEVDVVGWRGFQRDPANTGHAPNEDVSNGAEITWSRDVANSLRASPAVEDGVVFVTDRSGALHAVTNDGERWTVDGAFNENGVTVRDGTLYVSEGSNAGGGGLDGFLAGQTDKLRALGTEDGDERWSFETEATGGVPTVAYETVYVQDRRGKVYAVERSTGRLRWKAETERGIEVGAPAVGDCTVYVGAAAGDESGAVYAFDASDGEELWRYAVDGTPTAPTFHDGTVYLGVNGTGRLHAVDGSEGESVWMEETRGSGSIVHCSPAVDGERVYVGNYNGGHDAPAQRLFGHDAEGGEELWSAEASGYVWSSPGVAGDRVAFADLDGYVRFVDTTDGEVVNTVRLSDDLIRSSPAVVDGTVYVGSEDGSVYAVEG